MQIFRKLADVPADFGPTIVSVGNFDGVHRAHQTVLRDIAERARQSGAKSVAVTFEPHPIRILRPDSGFKLLTPTPEKLHLLAATGIDAVLLLPFGRDLSLLTPRQFAEEILKKNCGPSQNRIFDSFERDFNAGFEEPRIHVCRAVVGPFTTGNSSS